MILVTLESLKGPVSVVLESATIMLSFIILPMLSGDVQ